MSSGTPKTSTVQLSPEEVARLRENPENMFYGVTHDTVQYTPMKQVKQIMGVVRSLAHQFREEHPDWTDDKVRAEIRSRSAAADKMAGTTHPRLFNIITQKTVDDKTAEMIGFMIGLHERVESGDMSKEDSGTALYVKMLQDNGVGK